MSDTPETDAFMTRIRGIDGDKHWVPADTAKRLERERDEWAAMCGRYKQERDEIQEKYDKLATEHMLVVNKLCEERDEARAERDILRFDAQREAEHHDRLVKELEGLYDQNAKLRYIAERAVERIEQENWGITEVADFWKQLRIELNQLKEEAK